jgi:hypothetical protein
MLVTGVKDPVKKGGMPVFHNEPQSGLSYTNGRWKMFHPKKGPGKGKNDSLPVTVSDASTRELPAAKSGNRNPGNLELFVNRNPLPYLLLRAAVVCVDPSLLLNVQ